MTQLFSVFPAIKREVFEAKIFLLVLIFIYAFFKFTWAIRQFNYFSAVIGSVPSRRVDPDDRSFAQRMTIVLSHAIWQFNAGVRAYYFAIAALGWFAGPVVFIVLTVLMTVVLVRRQLYSPAARAIAEHSAAVAAALTLASDRAAKGNQRGNGSD